jgi:hypothetical protein
VAQLTAVVDQWLHTQTYILTTGPAEPLSCPQNVILLSEAPGTVREDLSTNLPIHLWRYPLRFQLQLWLGGWDLRIEPELLHAAAYATRFAADYRQRLLTETFQTLIEALRPQLFVGPTRQPPADLELALHGFRQWDTFYVGGVLAETFHWPQLLEEAHRPWQACLPTGGLWAVPLCS